ncbi:hypothetical protein [uncultured Devosia sp.]|uniref:hypothetical protein n=1 Tax=uncultured Devosia sp. TaxID=211434 RepID=UPI0035CC1FD6
MLPYEKAQTGLKLIEEAILEILAQSEEMTNSEVTRLLGLESDQDGKQKDYLAYSVLGRLVKAKLVTKVKGTAENRRYVGYIRSN